MNNDFTCAQSHDLLPGYVAGTLSDADMASIERHISQCTACQDELAPWCQLSIVAHKIDAIIPRAGAAVESATWAAIQAQLPSESSFASGAKLMEFDNHQPDVEFVSSSATPAQIGRRPRRRNTFFATVVAILLVALGAAVFALHPQSSKPGSDTKATSTSTSAITIDKLTNLEYKADAFLAPNDVWAVGQAKASSNGKIMYAVISHFDGTKWSTDPSNIFAPGYQFDEPNLTTISCGSPTDCWAAGSFLAHYTQGHWARYTVPSSKTPLPGVIPTLTGVQMFSATDGWGWKSFPRDLYHFTNGVWTEIGFQFDAAINANDPSDPGLSEVKMVSDTEGWAIGANQGQNALWHYLDGIWHTIHLNSQETAGSISGNIAGIGINSANDVWLEDLGGSFNGLSSSRAISGTTYASERPFSAPASGPNLAHYDGQTWTLVTDYNAPTTVLPDYGYQVPGDPFLEGARWMKVAGNDNQGNNMVVGLSRYQNGSWVHVLFPSSVQGNYPNAVVNILSVNTQSNGDVFAVVLRGKDISFEPNLVQLLRYSSGTWSVAG